MTTEPVENSRIALVTGGGTGIGKAIVARLLSEGYEVVAAGLEIDPALQRLASEMNTNLVWEQLDITNAEEREALCGRIEHRFGRLDVLVNNAGLSGLQVICPAQSHSEDLLRSVLDVNLIAPFLLAQAVKKLMAADRSPVIINVSSVAGAMAQENAAAYCMSKAGLDAMTRSLALEWAESGIRVVGVAPGDIATARSCNRGANGFPKKYVRTTPLNRQGKGEEVAAVVSFLCTSEASFVSGDVIRVDGGLLTY